MQNSEEIRRLVDTNRTAVDALTDPSLTARAKADHKARTDRTPYVCPIPDDMTRRSACPHLEARIIQ